MSKKDDFLFSTRDHKGKPIKPNTIKIDIPKVTGEKNKKKTNIKASDNAGLYN